MKKHFLMQSVVSALLLAALSLSACSVATGTPPVQSSEDPGVQANEVLVTEGTGQVVSLSQDPVAEYIRAMKSVTITGNDYCFNDEAGAGVAVTDYWTSGQNFSSGKSVHLSWEKTTAPYTVYVSTDENFEDVTEYVSQYNGLVLPNLYMATTYYWKVKNANGQENEISSFATEDGVRTLDTGYVNNVRDLGGRMTSSGKRVKQGVVYRGAEMNIQTYTDENNATHYINLLPKELDVLKNQMKVKTEIDFRTDAETLSMQRSALGDEVTYVRNPISAYTGMFCKHSNGTEKPEMRVLYQDTLRRIAQASEDNVVYFHCWGGADRTGTIGFLINGLLGVSYTDLLIDFELTTFSNNFRSREDNGKYYNYFHSMVTELKENYQKSEDETISTVIERYMKECLYLTDAEITSLKTNLIEG